MCSVGELRCAQEAQKEAKQMAGARAHLMQTVVPTSTRARVWKRAKSSSMCRLQLLKVIALPSVDLMEVTAGGEGAARLYLFCFFCSLSRGSQVWSQRSDEHGSNFTAIHH